MRTIKRNFAPLSAAIMTLAMTGYLGFQLASGLVPPVL
jgi:hypothetical protein